MLALDTLKVTILGTGFVTVLSQLPSTTAEKDKPEMQNIVHKLQNMIQTYYGFASQLDWHNNLDDAGTEKNQAGTLTVPLFEPKSKRPVAYFKVLDVPTQQAAVQEKLRELIQFSLQNYINLMDKLDVADNLLQYLQMELHPQKIIRLQGSKQSTQKFREASFNRTVASTTSSDFSFDHQKQALLLKSDSPIRLERLALSLHATAKNHFFLRTDQMGANFLTTINDLAGLNKTTLFIPDINSLSERQQKTLETFWLMTQSKNSTKTSAEVLVVAATQSTLSELVKTSLLNSTFLQNFDFFYLLSDSSSEAEIRFENLNQCAHAILQAAPEHHLKHHKFSQNIKSCHLIPSCESLFPSVH